MSITHPPDHLNILLAEDNIVNQNVVLAMLRRLGYTATLARNGQEVVQCFQTSFFHLVLMDLHMPHMDGYDTCAQIRSLYSSSQVWIVALTADVQATSRKRAMEAGMQAFITKPVTLTDLKYIIQECLNGLTQSN